MSNQDRVLIAGAGPVGMIAGYYLAKHNIPVTIFESLAGTATDHRASTVHPSTLDALTELDMTSEMISRGLISPVFQFRDRYDDRIVAEFDYGLIADETDHPFALQVEQHKVIDIARTHAEAFDDFTLMRPFEVTDVAQDDDGVEVTVRAPDGTVETHRGRYLIGADGGRSIVRKALGIDFPGFTWGERFVIATTKFDFGTPEAGNHRYRNYVAHPDQWCALIKVAGDDMTGLWRILLPASGDESDEEVGGEEWVQRKYAECLPYNPPYEIVHRNLYNVHQRVADNFVQYAADKGVHPAMLAVAWVMGHPGITAPIIGGRNLDQLAPSLAALDFEMSAEMRAEISALSVEPPPATDRAETQA